MKIYPKCLNHTMAPFVSQTGHLYPCCWNTGDVWNIGTAEERDRIFQQISLDDYTSVDEAMASDKWQSMMDAFTDFSTAPSVCRIKCAKPFPVSDYRDTSGNQIIHSNGHRSLHLELTSRCTIACSKCPRTIHKGKYAIADISMPVMEKIAQSSPVAWALMGNVGDPIYHRRFHEIVELANDNRKAIVMHTNGGRNTRWWEQAVERFDQAPHDQHVINFSIDGLEDTNHLYRVGSKWDECFNAMKLCAQSSRFTTKWKFIVFRHNQHQIEEAKEIAESIGVEFIMVKSGRWTDPNDPMMPDQEYVADYYKS